MLSRRDGYSSNVKIEKDEMYSARKAADLLEVTAETVKKYCRNGKIKGKRRGPKKIWHVQGSEIIKLRKAWGLDGV